MTVGNTTITYNFEYMRRRLRDLGVVVAGGGVPEDTPVYIVRDSLGNALCAYDGVSWVPWGDRRSRTAVIWAGTAAEAWSAALYAVRELTHKFFCKKAGSLSVWKLIKDGNTWSWAPVLGARVSLVVEPVRDNPSSGT